MSSHPIVILTALDLEYQAVREKLTGIRIHRHQQGTRFELGQLANGRCQVALAHVGKGNHSAAVLAERAIAEFEPTALLFVGVAGALHSHLALGDVVVATHIYAYHGGTSEDDGFKGRPRTWETSHSADQVARHLARTDDWARSLPGLPGAPKVHFGPIAAGEVVLNSAISAHARWVREHYNDALAIEMEGAGVAQAGHLNGALPVIVVRGISDRADGTKEVTDGAQWQPKAVANAAAFATALAEELAADEPSGGRPTAAQTRRSPALSETTRNVAMGNARVGVQAGTVYGGIRIGPDADSPRDLAQELAEFRELLQRARLAGDLDQDTYAAAQTELAEAGEAMRLPDSKGKLIVALKRLRGLISDVADLGSKLAVIINLVHGRS